MEILEYLPLWRKVLVPIKFKYPLEQRLQVASLQWRNFQVTLMFYQPLSLKKTITQNLLNNLLPQCPTHRNTGTLQDNLIAFDRLNVWHRN